MVLPQHDSLPQVTTTTQVIPELPVTVLDTQLL